MLLNKEDVEMNRLTKLLKSKSLRTTQPREELFYFLVRQDEALSPREIFKKIKSNSQTDLASVYRNLNLFEELELVHKFQNGEFILCCQDHNEEEHIHVVNHCMECGSSEELKSHNKALSGLANKFKGFSKKMKNIQTILVQGQCEKCFTE